MKKRIVLCADDYGQASSLSQGIIQLLEQQRLSATSCMVNTQSWAEQARGLIPFKNQVDIGLHINLTEGEALSLAWNKRYGKQFFPLPRLLCQAWCRLLDAEVVEAECLAQLDSFVASLGMLPDFVDGHQHIHQFPIIRQVLIKIYEERLRLHKAYVRLVNNPPKLGDKDIIKKAIIYATGTRALRSLLTKSHIPYNPSFAGIYTFSKAASYREFFPIFLKNITDGGLIMCHPGLAAPGTTDPISKARWWEYRYFASNDFLSDCQAHNVLISRFTKI